jgi:hypothetical protein
LKETRLKSCPSQLIHEVVLEAAADSPSFLYCNALTPGGI